MTGIPLKPKLMLLMNSEMARKRRRKKKLPQTRLQNLNTLKQEKKIKKICKK